MLYAPAARLGRTLCRSSQHARVGRTDAAKQGSAARARACRRPRRWRRPAAALTFGSGRSRFARRARALHGWRPSRGRLQVAGEGEGMWSGMGLGWVGGGRSRRWRAQIPALQRAGGGSRQGQGARPSLAPGHAAPGGLSQPPWGGEPRLAAAAAGGRRRLQASKLACQVGAF